MEFHPIDQVINQQIGPKGTPKRDIFEFDLNMAVIGESILRVFQALHAKVNLRVQLETPIV